MTPDGYPDDQELESIEKWDYRDAIGLIDFIRERWAYADWGFKMKWGKDKLLKRSWVMHLELHTGGWSGNESIIYALKRNITAMAVLNHRMWRAGGHFYFEFNPHAVGFKTVKEYCEEKKCSRQYVHKQKDKFIWLNAGPKIKMVKPIKTLNSH